MAIPKDSFFHCPADYNINIWMVIIPGGAKRPGQHKTVEGTEVAVDRAVFHVCGEEKVPQCA